MKNIIVSLIMSLIIQLSYSQNISNQETAILVVEFQKTWSEKTFFHRLIKKEYNRNNVYSNTIKLLKTARLNGVKVIQAPIILDKSNRKKYEVSPFPARFFRQFTKGTFKAEYTDGIYKESDIEVIGRCGFDACTGSNLLQILKNKKIKRVYITGFTTEHGVAETYDILVKNGYSCVIVSDCTATRNKRLQRKGENNRELINTNELVKRILI